jgi:hypothetical protein
MPLSGNGMTLALEQPAYLEMCRKFAEHFLWIASLKVRAGEDIGMWMRGMH